MDLFFCEIPKVELHAHLNGSLNTESILELGASIYGENTEDFTNLTKEFTKCNGFDEVFKKFQFMHKLTETKRGLALATELIIRDFERDNVIYLELRTSPKCNNNITCYEYLETVLKTIEQVNKNSNRIQVKLLPSINRSKPQSDAEETLKITLDLMHKYPNIIVGFDFSGEPNKGSFQAFKPILDNVRKHGLKLALHCAEIDNPLEIEEMLAFGMNRCGHGTFLSDRQFREMGKRNIAVECCLTSNIKCLSVNGYEEHHFKKLLLNDETKHIPVLCTDDSGVFDTTLTKEMKIAFKTYNLTADNIYQLSLNAIDHSFANHKEKDLLRSCVQDYFKNYDKFFNTHLK